MNCKTSAARRTAAAALVLALAAGTAAAAPTTWFANGHEYDVVTSEGITWTDANAQTTALGGGWHLATLTSADENAFVISLMQSGLPQRSHFWLGANDAASEGNFTWITGELFNFTDWWGAEPNNQGNEDYLGLDLRGSRWAWNDADDTLGSTRGFARGYVIERAAATVPEPAMLSLVGLALLAASRATRRRGGDAAARHA